MKEIYAVLLTSTTNGTSTLMPSSSGGILVFPTVELASAAAIKQFGQDNSNVATQVAQIGIVVT